MLYRPIDGNHPVLLADAGPGTDFYGSTKVAAEALCFAYHQALGLDFRTIRPSAVYGLGMNQYVGPIKAMVENAVRGVPGVADASVEVVWDEAWGPHRLSESARTKLRFLPDPIVVRDPKAYVQEHWPTAAQRQQRRSP